MTALVLAVLAPAMPLAWWLQRPPHVHVRQPEWVDLPWPARAGSLEAQMAALSLAASITGRLIAARMVPALRALAKALEPVTRALAVVPSAEPAPRRD